ncbi:MAG: hypothetical protein HOP17_10515 [Acidobacteria bacterium]|nr:hypothetical protein [Acidobacteriota bacterium]
MKNRDVSRISIIVCLAVFFIFCSLLYFAGFQMISAQDKVGESIKPQTDAARIEEDDECGSGGTVRLPATKLIIEHNSTAADTGVHGLFDGADWTNLEILDPRGRSIFEFEPKRQFRTQSISGVFFESAEPPNSEVPISEIFRRFPAGQYPVRGCTPDGERITGSATFTHNIPAAPVITFPMDGNTVPVSGLTLMWNHVTTTLDGRPLNRTGYELILTKQVADDPNGFSKPVLSVHLPPGVNSCSVPNQFLQAGTQYEIEVLVLEVSGNQTITSLFFQTQ